MQKVVSKKTADEAKETADIPMADRKQDKIEMHLNAHNQVDIDIKGIDVNNPAALASKLISNTGLANQLSGDEWKNALQYIVPDEEKRKALVEELKKKD